MMVVYELSRVEYAEDKVIQPKTFFPFPPKARTEEFPTRVTILNDLYGCQQSSLLLLAGQELLVLGDRMVEVSIFLQVGKNL